MMVGGGVKTVADFDGVSPRGKAWCFDRHTRRFESFYPSFPTVAYVRQSNGADKKRILIPTIPYLRLQGSNPCRWILQDNVSFLSKHSFQLPLCSHGFRLSPSSVVGANPTVAIRYFIVVRGSRKIHDYGVKIRQVPSAQPLADIQWGKNKPKTLTFSFVLRYIAPCR